MSSSTGSLLQRALSGFAVSIVLRVARLLMGFVLVALLNRHLGPGGVGQLMIALAWVAPLLCLTELGFNRITVRELARRPEHAPEILGTTFYTRIVAGVLLLGVALAISSLLQPSVQMLVWVYALLLPTHASSDLLLWFESKGQLAAVTWAQFRGFALAGAIMVVGIFMGAPPVFFAATYVIECWAAVAILAWQYHRQGQSIRAWRWSSVRSLRLLAESWPEMLAQFSMLLLFRLDALMLGWLRGDVEAGIYSIAVRLSELVYFVAPLLGSAFLPRLVELRQTSPEMYSRRLSEYLGINLAFAIACSVALMLLAPWLVMLLGGERFEGSVGILMVHAWGVVGFYFGIARTQYLAAEHRLSANLPSVFVGLLANTLLNLWWIPRWSGLGAAWATVVSYTLAWVAMTVLSRDLRPLLRLQVQGLVRLPGLAAESLRHGQDWWRLRRA